MISRDRIIDANPIARYLEAIGHELKGDGAKASARCPFHDDKSPSMSVNTDKGLWFCHACGFGGTVIDMHMRRLGLSCKDALAQLAEQAGLRDDMADKPQKVATYIYRDSLAREVMRIDRIETGKDKKFRQYTVDPAGQEHNGIDGVARVLFRMERWAGKDAVALCEGEKCVAALESIGKDATTNPGGSSNWKDAYAQYLVGKHVEVWPDNDAPGEKWLAAVLKSLEGKVAALRIMRVPDPYNDVADMVIAQGNEYAKDAVFQIGEATPWIDKGVDLPLLSSREAFDIYRRRVLEAKDSAIDLGRWLPSLASWSRPLMPGDMMVIQADTGVGKTALLLNLAYSQRPLPCIMFEIELSECAMVERFIARDLSIETLEVERAVERGHEFDVSGWSNVYLCPESKLDAEKMGDIIERSELKIGRRPALVLVDYIGLMDGPGGKRYERMSTIAEDLKRLARSTRTVVCVASQVARDKDRTEISLHDSRDSSSIESSAQLVLGAWRPGNDRLTLRILKQTRRAGVHDIECRYDGNKQTIQELFDENH
jgi:hypothetical protein